MNKNRIISMFYMLYSISLAVSCTTLSSHKTAPGPSSSSRALESHMGKTPVVAQTKTDRFVLSKLDRATWVELRQSTKDSRIKLFSGLAVKEWDVAIDDAKAFLMNHPKDRTALIVLSSALAMKGNLRLAYYYANLVEKYHGDYPEVNNLKGIAMLHRSNIRIKDQKMAAYYFQNALRKDENQIAAGLNLGHLQLKMGNAQHANETFRLVLGRCSLCTEALFGHGLALTRLKDYDKAKDIFTQIIDREPNNHVVNYMLAVIEKNGFNNYDKAKDYLKVIIADTSFGNNAIKRQANFLLNRMDAEGERNVPNIQGETANERIVAADHDEGEDAINNLYETSYDQ